MELRPNKYTLLAIDPHISFIFLAEKTILKEIQCHFAPNEHHTGSVGKKFIHDLKLTPIFNAFFRNIYKFSENLPT